MNPRLRKMLKSAARRVRRPLRRHLRPHGLILMYHRVAAAEQDPWQLCVTPENFRQHLEVLARRADVVPLPEFSEQLRSARSKRPIAAITFDDGYLDNYAEALPLLREFHIPATFFIATDAVGRNEPFWWDTLSELALAGPLPAQVVLDIAGTEFRWQANSPQVSRNERHALHRALWTRLQVVDDAARRTALQALCTLNDFDPQRLLAGRAMNADELRDAHASGLIEFGGHTASHCPLPKRSAAVQRQEILASRQQLETLLGRAPTSFAYPYGEFDQTSRDLAAECGFVRACTTKEDLVWAGEDRMLLSRFGVPNTDGRGFEYRLCRTWLA